MTILLTGGAGRTSSAITQRLHQANVPFLILSRSGSAPAPFQGCRFDWGDKSTYEIPFTQASHIDALYIVVPVVPLSETAEPINAFIDFAKAKGVPRFVLLSASNVEPGRWIMGDVHQHLASLQVAYVALRPTWFMDNFSRNQAPTIRNEGKIYSSAGDGKIAWISCDDVGAAGYHALTAKSVSSTDTILLGPELLSYDDIAALLSDVLGRPIEHVRISPDMFKGALLSAGVPPVWTQILVDMEAEVYNRVEEKLNNEVLRITNQSPINFREWAEKNKSVWLSV